MYVLINMNNSNTIYVKKVSLYDDQYMYKINITNNCFRKINYHFEVVHYNNVFKIIIFSKHINTVYSYTKY